MANSRKFYLRMREYPGTPRVDCWLIHRMPGGVESALLSGFCDPDKIAEFAETHGLAIERNSLPFENRAEIPAKNTGLDK